MSVASLDFSILQDEIRGLQGDVQYDTLELFEKALKSSPSSDIAQQTRNFVIPILASFSDAKALYGESEKSFAQETYDAFLLISTCIPSGHYAQEVLLGALPLLEQKGEMWDMWQFKMRIRGIWNNGNSFNQLRAIIYRCANSIVDATSEIDDPDNNEERLTLGEWLNLNSFIAKCFENNIPQSSTVNAYINFALWEMRSALEEPSQKEKDVTTVVRKGVFDMKVRVACEWVTVAGKALLVECLRNCCEDHPNGGSQGRPYGPGSLFQGAVGFGLERWGFWKRRLVEVKATVGEEVHGSIDKALAKMKAVEKEAFEAFLARVVS
jgi:hypothetical protein